MMNIGIDLDNTIINYQTVFPAAANSLDISLPENVISKNQIRDYLRQQPDGEKKWQQLQGIAYGKCLRNYARVFPGIKRFFWRCLQLGHKIVIVSHKTEYGHFDEENISLRQVALEFLKRENLIIADDTSSIPIIFEDTRGEKIATISRFGLKWFIDDLTEVVDELSKQDDLKVIYFNPDSSKKDNNHFAAKNITELQDWQQIDALINGEWTEKEIKHIALSLIDSEVVDIEKVTSGGNSATYKLFMPDGSIMKLKIYPVDANHDRLFSEFLASSHLSGMDTTIIPKLLAQDKNLGVSLFEWVEGDPVTSIDNNDIEMCLEVLSTLHSISREPGFADLPRASAACFSGNDIEKQINYRLEQYLSNDLNSAELNNFLTQSFIPVSNELLSWAKKNWPKDYGYDESIPKFAQTLSPSDFGFHNAIRRPDGALTFLDFEYYGWDDPVKLISDFSFHPGMQLSEQQLSFWISKSLALYGEHIAQRLIVCRPLYGLIWCLILLNDFRPQVWQRRLLANNNKTGNRQKMLDYQLSRANALLHNTHLTYNKLFEELNC